MARALTTEEVDAVLENSDLQLREEDATFHRYLMDEIDGDQEHHGSVPKAARRLHGIVDTGVRRETFFYNQVHKDHAVAFTGVGDFVVDGKWTFEIGGKRKGFGQIADLPNSYVVNDDVSVGRGNKIPLWLFGFLY